MKIQESSKLFKKAKRYFPGGVNSPVRAFGSVDGDPLFITKGDGCRITDADGNEYIDYCGSWGPLIMGHNNQAILDAVIETAKNGMSFGAPTLQENELADLILSNNTKIEKIRFVNSGTEAVMSAIRLARGYTKRSKIIKFDGCYHGHADYLLVKAGSGLATLGTSSSDGVPDAFTKETIVLPLADKAAIESAFENFPDEIACVIIEPVPANNGLLLQDASYLEFLREICTEHGALLLFDEVITGFRLGIEGAAGYYNIQPDICTYGKIIGGGMPVGAYGASEEIMSIISPLGGVYQAGTLSGNPVAMAAGIAQIKACVTSNFYSSLADKTKTFIDGLNRYIREKSYSAEFIQIGSIFWIKFNTARIERADQIDPESMNQFRILHRALLDRGIYLGPSGYEVGFVSTAHTLHDLELTATAIKEGLDIVFAK